MIYTIGKYWVIFSNQNFHQKWYSLGNSEASQPSQLCLTFNIYTTTTATSADKARQWRQKATYNQSNDVSNASIINECDRMVMEMAWSFS